MPMLLLCYSFGFLFYTFVYATRNSIECVFCIIVHKRQLAFRLLRSVLQTVQSFCYPRNEGNVKKRQKKKRKTSNWLTSKAKCPYADRCFGSIHSEIYRLTFLLVHRITKTESNATTPRKRRAHIEICIWNWMVFRYDNFEGLSIRFANFLKCKVVFSSSIFLFFFLIFVSNNQNFDWKTLSVKNNTVLRCAHLNFKLKLIKGNYSSFSLRLMFFFSLRPFALITLTNDHYGMNWTMVADNDSNQF